MPRCPKCHCKFRVPEDEECPPQHECPRCGYDGHEPKDEPKEEE